MASSSNREFEQAYKEYQNSVSAYNKANDQYLSKTLAEQKGLKDKASAVEKAGNQYTGNAGYANSVAQAKNTANELSNIQAANSRRQAQTAARGAGMTKAQAAALGAGQSANAYNNAYANNFSNQQAQVAQQGQNAVNAAQTNYGNQLQNANYTSNAYGNYAANKGNVANMNASAMGATQTEKQNEYNRAWGNVSNAMGIGGSLLSAIGSISDERMKNYVKLSDTQKKYKKREYEKLKYKAVE